jgi:hypothetical protein
MPVQKMKFQRLLPALLAVAALTGCGSTTTSTTSQSTAHTSAAAKSSAVPATTTTTSTATAVAMARDRNPSQPDYWSPKLESSLVSSCGSNKIAPTENMCNCIVSSLQSHHPGAAQGASQLAAIRKWFQTGSGNTLGLKDYALNCGQA